MGTISSSVGLISGLNIEDIVKQLMTIESRPLTLLKTRITQAQTQQQAYLTMSARLLATKTAVTQLSKSTAFLVKTASSSNSDVLTATATEKASPGNYSFTVRSLASTHQLVSAQSFASRDSVVGAGSLTLEIGAGTLTPTNTLSSLNGFEGIQRGKIRITDRSGASAEIDLRAAVDMDEVLSAINNQNGVRVRASIDGDKLVIRDATGLTTGTLSVSDLGTGRAAAELGIAGTSATGEIVGADVFNLSQRTRLSYINDGNGLRTAGVADDLRFTLRDGRQVDVNLSGMLRFGTRLAELNDGRGVDLGTIKITNRKGESQTLDLSGAQTIQDVVSAINNSGLSVSVALSNSKLSITDTSKGTAGNLKIEDVTGTTAADLGIVADTDKDGFVGSSIYRMDTIGSVLRAIQYAAGNDGALSAAISSDGNGLVVTDNTVGAGEASIEALNNSKALEDLGLAGGFNASGVAASDRLIGGLGTVLLKSLNGGSGVDTSSLQIRRTVGGVESTETVDVSQAKTLQEVLDAINAKTDGSGNALFRAEVDAGGTTIRISDIAGGVISGFDGATATDLKLTAKGTAEAVSGDLNLRYISETTLLSSLNLGQGISMGSFRISSSNGTSGLVTLTKGVQNTVGDVLKAINNLNLNVTARINANGDGIELVDSAGGTQQLTVQESGGGTTAASLGIQGTAKPGETAITGTFARTIDVSASDTLDGLVTKINDAKAGVKASVINDGTGYRLILSSSTSGAAGRMSFSTTLPDMSLDTLSRAQDASVVIGNLDSPNAIVLTSGSNTFTNVVDGLTLNLHGTSTDPVNISVSQDVETVLTNVKTMITTFNEAFDTIDELTKYDQESEAKGILLGESAMLTIRERLYSVFSAKVSGGDYDQLVDVGITIKDGARLSIDEAKFKEAFAADPEEVARLFTLTTTEGDKTVKRGIATRMAQTLEELTGTTDGLITQQRDRLQDKVDMYNARSTQMQKLLDQKEQRLYNQFQAMETALAKLQSQQSYLNSLSSMASSASASAKTT